MHYDRMVGGRAQSPVLPGPGDGVQALHTAGAQLLLLPTTSSSALHTLLQRLYEGSVPERNILNLIMRIKDVRI
jgi:hypothetical protein